MMSAAAVYACRRGRRSLRCSVPQWRSSRAGPLAALEVAELPKPAVRGGVRVAPRVALAGNLSTGVALARSLSTAERLSLLVLAGKCR